MNQHGSCELKCGDDWEMKRYKTGGLLEISVVIGLGHEVCCCAPKLVLPTLPPLPSIALPSIALPSIAHTGVGPSFDDVSSMNGNPPDCVYPWIDPLHCK